MPWSPFRPAEFEVQSSNPTEPTVITSLIDKVHIQAKLVNEVLKQMFFQMQVPQGNQQYGGSYGAQRSHVPMGPMNGMSPMNSMGSMAMMGQGSGPMHGNMMSAGMGKMAMQVSSHTDTSNIHNREHVVLKYAALSSRENIMTFFFVSTVCVGTIYKTMILL